MIRSVAGFLYLTCDECSERGALEKARAGELRRESHEAGWRQFRRAGYVLDACPACVRAWAVKQTGQEQLL